MKIFVKMIGVTKSLEGVGHTAGIKNVSSNVVIDGYAKSLCLVFVNLDGA